MVMAVAHDSEMVDVVKGYAFEKQQRQQNEKLKTSRDLPTRPADKRQWWQESLSEDFKIMNMKTFYNQAHKMTVLLSLAD